MSPTPASYTFLFTDIEGSTRLWEEYPAEMASALAIHDRILRETICESGGEVFKTMGDAFCAVFRSPSEAASAAIAGQRRLLREVFPGELPIQVRMAVFTGSAERRDGDYFGLSLSRVARLLGIGHGGQILVSSAAQDSLAALPPGVELASLGEHRLRGLAQPEHVFQLVAPDLPNEFPRLRSVETAPANNLPHQVTSFVGRERELTEVSELLLHARLLTLTGPGGSGKSRLAVQVAAERTDPDGIWLVELAAIPTGELVIATVSSTLGVRESAAADPEVALINALRERSLLLILDNCEHLVTECARLADSLLRHCPGVRVMATSREALGIAGETVYRVPVLSLPNETDRDVDMLRRSEAVRLFEVRATAAKLGFALTPENGPVVAQVCRQLDGIPLAIELAAARVRALPVEQIAQRLDDRFRLLTGGSRTALPRQQTLRALIAWSYDLLMDEEQALLRRLSVFAGGWTLDSAVAVCAQPPLEDWQVVDVLMRLVDKSLVVFEERGSDSRYRLLESVRQFAADCLREAGEGDQFHNRHLAHFSALAEEAEPHLHTDVGLSWLARLDAENDNLRAALRYGAASGRALRLAAALRTFWSVRGRLSEGSDRYENLMGRLDRVAPDLRAKVLYSAGTLALARGEYSAAETRLAESLKCWRALGDADGIFRAASALGGAALQQGRTAEAAELLEEALGLARDAGDERQIASLSSQAGLALYQVGESARAIDRLEDAVRLARTQGQRTVLIGATHLLGEVLANSGDEERGTALLRESVSLAMELGYLSQVAQPLEEIARISALHGDGERAARLYGAAESIRARLDFPMTPERAESIDRARSALAAGLGAEAFERARAEGLRLPLEEAVALAGLAPSEPTASPEGSSR